MTEPTFDEDGYPTDETLAAIENWPYQDIAGCLDFCRRAWHWGEAWANEDISAHEAAVVHAEKGERYARFATGGWSGNESIVNALDTNYMIHALAWRLSARGGLHIYEYPQIGGG